MSVDLGELGKQADRAAAKRRQGRQGVPESRVGASLRPVALPPAEEPLEPPVQSEGPVEASSPSPRPTPAPKSASVVVDDLVKTTIHLGSAQDAFLESVRYAGRSARPKIDASRSAVARLAIARLAEEMDPAEIVAELQRRSSPTGTPGRRRN